MSEWLAEEKAKFLKKKALYQKTGLSNAFKYGTKTMREIRSKIEYLKEVVEWTITKQTKKQWKLELVDMKEWVVEFEQRIALSYRPNESKPVDKEKIWKFNEEVYEREMARAFEEEEGEGTSLSTPKAVTRGRTRYRSDTSNSKADERAGNFERDRDARAEMAATGSSFKMAAVENRDELGQDHLTMDTGDDDEDTEEEPDDYYWSDRTSMESRRENVGRRVRREV